MTVTAQQLGSRYLCHPDNQVQKKKVNKVFEMNLNSPFDLQMFVDGFDKFNSVFAKSEGDELSTKIDEDVEFFLIQAIKIKNFGISSTMTNFKENTISVEFNRKQLRDSLMLLIVLKSLKFFENPQEYEVDITPSNMSRLNPFIKFFAENGALNSWTYDGKVLKTK